VKRNDAKGVQAEHGKLGALKSDTLYKKFFSGSVCSVCSTNREVLKTKA
jgi:hypothetical protein